MGKKFEARIIGETSAGLTALEIYVDGKLFWSGNYFENGASASWYAQGLRQIYDDAMACAEIEEWAEFKYDSDGAPIVAPFMGYRWDVEDGCRIWVPFDDQTSWVVATYRPESGWEFSAPREDGQAKDFICHNRDRIPAEVVAQWEQT